MDRLDKFLLKELLEIGKQLGLAIKAGIKKNELKELIEKDIESKENTDIAWGTLEVLPDGYGFLRGTSVEKDIYVSASQVRKFKLRTEDRVVGEVREPSGDEKNYALKKVLLVNDGTLEAAEARVPFEELIPAYPTEKFILETDSKNISGRIIDLIAPIGRGQRALIIAPPKAGKTMLISNLANSIMKTSKDAEVWILLIDERPEEVTDIKENVIGAQVFASTFDEDPKNHIKVTESILERAKRKVENGENIVILMDSLTRLARAYNIVIPSSGKLISGGIDPTALYYPKNFFGTARNIRGGGSLTIIATVLVDTGSKMDDIIYEEFKSTGNCDIHLDRNLAELRLFPAIDIQRSGTRKEELLIPKKELESIWKIRRHLAKFDKAESLKRLVDTLKSTQSNKSMLEQFEKGVGDEK
ncbi:MAG: transcription termination factor Rho [Fusobacterium mortiferum]|jgi:transcription termination factor Rho|uniref:Transcription termination factor Rho n=2 Tax=Fusobacterium mortiferum TaxID=850 RepID=A0A414Q0N6_FUSMR|nr:MULTISPECIES: transcription termination factor Rho [Fusobacterium]AVQ18375.1 transcription termination factor Rho [Fusobacterium mortiferum ATCC 9817]EEO34609.2 transcription termination factor Rho [Fusobacterium mortiferum ATCC 9817]MCF2626547.1 transcription termination factor Rho [Fusobacterium mortiferum]MCF2699750.1 transcription termination factor Rho [Fusobacterium mortiferum]MCI6381632.1 transcription termination factor Rho [Fusobacterium mortiferum]